MSDWSGKRDPLVEEWMVAVLLFFGLAPLAVVKLCGGSWGTLAAGWGVLLVVAGLAVLGRWGVGLGAGVANRSGAAPRRRRVRVGIHD